MESEDATKAEINYLNGLNYLSLYYLTFLKHVTFDSWLPMTYSGTKIKHLIVNGVACAKYPSYMYALTTHTKVCIS